MAGHSKWKNIQHRKGMQDAKRGQVFTRLIREITISARQGADPAINHRLRAAMDKALDSNMSKDTIQKAINKGAGLEGATELTEIVFEGYGPEGVAFIVECATDNKNRTVPEIRHCFAKAGGSLGTNGSVSFMFKDIGLIELDASGAQERLFDLALELGATDIEEHNGCILIECEPYDLFQIAKTLKKEGYKVINSQKNKIPLNTVAGSLELEEKITILYDKFDEHDDVQAVYCNYAWDKMEHND